METRLEASVNVLWQNLLALNASLVKENEERRAELLQTKKLLENEIENSNALLAANKKQLQELLKRNQKIALLYSKLVAVKQIASFEVDDDHQIIDKNSTTTLPVIVKVESVEPDKHFVALPVNVCTLCDKKLGNSANLKRHMLLHSDPTHVCPICPLKFARPDYVLKHIRRAHQDDSPKGSRLRTKYNS